MAWLGDRIAELTAYLVDGENPPGTMPENQRIDASATMAVRNHRSLQGSTPTTLGAARGCCFVEVYHHGTGLRYSTAAPTGPIGRNAVHQPLDFAAFAAMREFERWSAV